MINRISEEIAYRLNEQLQWVDSCVGIVKEISYQSKSGKKTIPVYFNGKRDLCNGGDYIDLIPDSNKTSIAYMELNQNPSVVETLGRGTKFSTDIDIIFWFNYQKINIGMVDNDILIANVIDAIPRRIDNDTYNSVFIEVKGASVSNDDIFSKYTYNADTQFTMYPYGSFVVTIGVEYVIPKSCISLGINDSDCRIKPITLTIGKDVVEVPFGVIKY